MIIFLYSLSMDKHFMITRANTVIIKQFFTLNSLLKYVKQLQKSSIILIILSLALKYTDC
jgi:hypothetical protein